MHDKEIQYFTEGLNLAKDEFYLDSINKFKMLIDEYPQSDLADDALYNVGLCYFKIKQFEQAIETFNQVITNYPDATISALDSGNEFGKTAAKCHYGIFQCFLLLGKVEEVNNELEKLKPFNQNTYILIEGEKVSFEKLAKKMFIQFKNDKNE
jgi:tetratricopeptide (TPR) repeat protein